MSIKAGDVSYLPVGSVSAGRAHGSFRTQTDVICWPRVLRFATLGGHARPSIPVFKIQGRLTQINATPFLVCELTIGWATRV
jgi:hypothetical protein